MERAEFGSGHVCSASRPDSRLSTNWQGEGGRKEEKGIRRREGEERRRRRRGRGTRRRNLDSLSRRMWERNEEES